MTTAAEQHSAKSPDLPLGYRRHLAIRLPFVPRSGQEEAWEFVVNNPARKHLLFAFCPGYGKTKLYIGAYGIDRDRGMVNRLLVIVANRVQRRQAHRELVREAGTPRIIKGGLIGVKTIDKKTTNVLLAHQRNEAEVFITTYQGLLETGKAFFDELMATGNWLVVRDEVHHNAEGKPWGERSNDLIEKATCKRVINLTGTVIRTDKKYLTGINYRPLPGGEVEAIADINIDIQRGIRERALRPFHGYIHNYTVDVRIDGHPKQITTDELKGERDPEAFLSKRKLRLETDYINKMLRDAMTDLERRSQKHPYQHQGLIWAMNLDHAEIITRQLNEEHRAAGGKGDVADWIGISRTEDENEAILNRYLGVDEHGNEIPPEKRLLWLVQVGKAGEGFDNPRTSVLVFMNLISAESPTIQNLCRGARRNPAIPVAEDYCSVYASTDSPIAEIVRDLEAACKFKLPDEDDTDGQPGGDDEDDGRLPRYIDLEIENCSWDRTDHVTTNGVGDPVTMHAEAQQVEQVLRAAGFPIPAGVTDAQLLQLRASFEHLRGAAGGVGGGNGGGNGGNGGGNGQAHTSSNGPSPRDLNAMEREWSRKILTLTKTIMGIVLKLQGGPDSSARKGEIMKAINTQWVKLTGQKHSTMLNDQLARKHAWLKKIHDDMHATRVVPGWLK